MKFGISTAKPKILVTRKVFPEHLARLTERFDVMSNQEDISLAPSELAARLADKEGALVTGGDRIDETVLMAAVNLRVVSSISVGHNHIDLAACTHHRVMATNTPDVLTETTADLAWALMMAAARRITESERWLRAGHWKRWSLDGFLGVDVHHSTLGILGMGRIGQAIARRARGFSMRTLYHNRSRLQSDIEDACGAQYVERDALFRHADHVILVLPYSPENHHCVGSSELNCMKPGATLTNIARGGLIDEVALCKALRDGRIAAAGLDVFEGEPDVLSDLLSVEHVALTPHIGSASRATRDAMAQLAIDNLLEAFSGVRPRCLLNPEAWRN